MPTLSRAATTSPLAAIASATTTDIRYAWRQLARRPAHTAAVIACLIVGLTASVGMFSFITSIFTGDMPGIAQRRDLLRVYLSYDSAANVETTASIGATIRRAAEPLSFSDFTAVRQLGDLPSIEVMGAEGTQLVTGVGRHGPVSVDGAFASGDFFRALRTLPQAGRLFSTDDDRVDAPPVAVVADHFWRTQLDARPDAVGSAILISGRSVTVIGVAPPRFHGLRTLDIGEDDSRGVQVWLPLAHAAAWPSRTPENEPWLNTVARRRGASTIPDVEGHLAVAAARIAAARPAERAGATPFVRTMGLGPTSSLKVMLLVATLLALPLIVLAIGCANVANLQLARATEQSRELAVRLALGATRAQLARLLTIEALARVLIAVAVSIGLVRTLLRLIGPLFPVFLTIDWRVLTFAITLAVVVALATGLLPAWLVLRSTAAGEMKQTAHSGGTGHSRLRSSLVVVQVSLSLALLVLAGLFMRTAQTMVSDAPTALRQQIVANFNPTELRMTPLAARQFADTVVARAARDARVTAAAVSTDTTVRIAAPAGAARRDIFVSEKAITPTWLDAMDARVLAGRRLSLADDRSVVMISAHTADLVAPGASPLGVLLQLRSPGAPDRQVRVIGVVEDLPTRPTVDRPDPVVYATLPSELARPFTLRVRSVAPEALSADVTRIINAVDPRIAWTSIRRGDMVFEDEAREMRYGVLAAGAAALVALLLSATGLYAVMSFSVQLRRREIGVRVAIGAEPARIAALILRQALSLVAVGLVIGLTLAVPMAFLMRANFVARVTALDPLVFGSTTVLLLIVGTVAAIVPALRASRLDPITTLREN